MGPLAQHKKRFETDPSAEASFAVLEEHHFMEQQWAELVSVYETRLGAPSIPAQRVEVLVRLGRILEERCGDPEGAIERYTEALHAEPSLRSAMTALRRIYARREEWEQMFRVAESEAELPLNAHDRASLLCEVGKICLDGMQDPERARGYLDRALGEVPVHRDALAALARVLDQLDEPAEAVRTLKRLAHQTRGLDKAKAFHEAGRLSANRLDKLEQAGHLFRAALEIVPSMQAAREDLARLEVSLEAETGEVDVVDEGRFLEALLETKIGSLSDKKGAGVSLADETKSSASDFENPSAAESHLEAAERAAAEGDHPAAIASLELAVQENQAHVGPLELLAEILGAVDVLNHLVEATPDPSRRGALLTRMGNSLKNHLEQADGALSAYESALQADPALHEPFDALCELHSKIGNWDELRSLLEGFRRFGPPERRVEILVQLGELLERHFKNIEEAKCAFEEALQLEPKETRAQEALARLSDPDLRSEQMIKRYKEQAKTATDPVQRREFALKLVCLLEHVDRIEEALEWALRIAGENRGDRKTLEAVARLQKSLGLEGQLRETLGELDTVLDEGERTRNRGPLDEIDIALGHRDSVIPSSRRVPAAKPSKRQALEALVSSLTEAENWRELAEVRESLVDVLDSPAREGCLSELADLYIDRLEDRETGIKILQRLESERKPPAGLDSRLDELLEQAGHFDQVAHRLAQRRAKLEPGSQQVLVVARAEARIRAEHLEQWREAVDVLQEAGPGVLDDPEALAELERYARSCQDDALLVDVLSGSVSCASDSQARICITVERAKLLEGLPGRCEEARDAYRGLLAEDLDESTRTEVLERLEALLEQGADWSSLREVLEHQLESATPERAGQLHSRLGWLCHTHLQEAVAAVAHFESWVLLQPDAMEAWRHLAAHYSRVEQPRDERRVLEGWLAVADTSEARELHSRIARLSLRLGDAETALAQYSKAFELDQTDAETSEFLYDAHRRDGRVREAVKVLESRLAALDEAAGEGSQEAARLLRLRIAEQRADALSDLAGAIAVLEPAASDGSDLERYAEPLAVLCERAGCPEELIELSKRVLAVTTVPGDRARWQLRIAEASHECGLEDEAIAAYCSLLELRPSYPRVEDALAELYRGRDEIEPLIELLETRLKRHRGASAVALHIECAGLLEQRLERSEPALEHLRRAVAIDPGHSGAIELGLGIAEHLGKASVEFEFLKHMFAAATPIRDRCRRLVRLGELQLAKGEAEAAVSSWIEALTLDSRQPALCTRLREQLEEMGRIDEALHWLAIEVDQAKGEAGTALCKHGVELASDTSGPEAALPWVERLWRLRPTDASFAARVANLNEQLGRHTAALRALEAQRSLSDTTEAVDIELRRARIYEDHLELPARAIACLEDARVAVPDATEILERLEGLYARAGRHRERAEVLEALLPSTKPAARVERIHELSKLWGGPLANPDRAVSYLEDALGEAQEGAPQIAVLLAELRGFLASSGHHVEWARVTERELRMRLATSESDTCCVLRLHLARTYERELCRPDLALPHWEKLVDAQEPSQSGATPSFDRNEAETALLRLLRTQGRPVEFERRLTAHMKRKPGGAEAWIELANLRERLQLVSGASAAWHRVLELDTNSIEGMRGVQRAAERLAQWPDLAQMIERELTLAANASAAEQAALLRRLAEVRLHGLQEPDEARNALERILALGEEDLESLRMLETLVESAEDWDATLEVYRKEIGYLGQQEPTRRRTLWLRIATIERQHNDATERALKALQQADSLDALTGELLSLRAKLELALDDKQAYARTMARWCDDPTGNVVAADHVKLARLLDELGQHAEAATRIERAVAKDNIDAQVWALAGELREKNNDPGGAQQAYLRAADTSDGDQAAQFLGNAAALLETTDFAGACELLNRAIYLSRRPIPSLHARRIFAAAELGRHDDVLESARCIAELAEAQADLLERDELLNLLVAGARSARTLERAELLAQLCGAVRKLEPDHEEALVGMADAFCELESWEKARLALEQLLSLSGRDAQRTQDLGQLGIVLERLEVPSDAADTYRMALDRDPDFKPAVEGLIRSSRASGRLTECLDALLESASRATSNSLCADGFVQAAEIALELGRPQEAIDHLQAAREADPRDPRAWQREIELLDEAGKTEAADALAAEGLGQLEDSLARAELALRRARKLEADGDTSEAIDLFLLAAELDSNQVPAALGAARTLHSLGEAKQASDFLSHFLATFPNVDTYAAAPVWLAAAQLRAGPMDDPQGAAAAYRRALKVAPDLTLARDELAELLVRLPDSRTEAISLHAQILTDRPADVHSLRALLTLAEAGGDALGVANGLEILTALGVATPEERERSSGNLRLTVAGAARFEEPLWECVGRLLRVGSKALDQILPHAVRSESEPAAPATRFRRAAREAEAKMTAAGCALLDDREFHDLVVGLAGLAARSTIAMPDRVWAASLSGALGWFARFRLKRALARHSPRQIADMDFSAWRNELRRRARAWALDATDGDLSAALVSVVSDDKGPEVRGLDPESDLTPLVGDCLAGRDLMRDVTLSWVRSLSSTTRKGGFRASN